MPDAIRFDMKLRIGNIEGPRDGFSASKWSVGR